MFPSSSTVTRFFAYNSVVNQQSFGANPPSLVGPQVADGVIVELNFASNDTSAATVEVILLDPAGVAVVLGQVDIPAATGGDHDKSVDALQAIGGGIADAIRLPVGWSLCPRLLAVPAVGLVLGTAVLGVA